MVRWYTRSFAPRGRGARTHTHSHRSPKKNVEFGENFFGLISFVGGNFVVCGFWCHCLSMECVDFVLFGKFVHGNIILSHGSFEHTYTVEYSCARWAHVICVCSNNGFVVCPSTSPTPQHWHRKMFVHCRRSKLKSVRCLCEQCNIISKIIITIIIAKWEIILSLMLRCTLSLPFALSHFFLYSAGTFFVFITLRQFFLWNLCFLPQLLFHSFYVRVSPVRIGIGEKFKFFFLAQVLLFWVFYNFFHLWVRCVLTFHSFSIYLCSMMFESTSTTCYLW